MWFVVQHFKMMMLKYQEVLVVDLLQQLISNLVLRIEDIVIDDDNKKKNSSKILQGSILFILI